MPSSFDRERGGKRRLGKAPPRSEKAPTWQVQWGHCPETGKRSFPRVGDVKRAARASNLRYYLCAHCGEYHLTGQSAAMQKVYKMLKEADE